GMFDKLAGEYTFFKTQELNVRTLLITNMLYAMILPVIEIFVGAYIMRNTNNSSYVFTYQLSMYCGIVATSALNGLLIKKIKASLLYGFGIILSTVVLMAMMFFSFVG
ncbi:MAG TPA: MFS transporter, partial [Porphyromonadaceae bacterium]|nr:MFS transporter [Porphyromonadaceae bacterium]